jgi:hypothetical protein
LVALTAGVVLALRFSGMGRRAIPELTLEPLPTATDTGAIAIDPVLPPVPIDTSKPSPGAASPRPHSNLPPPTLGDAGAIPPGSTNPPAPGLPFPPLTLPSSLPPLPSGLPTALPPGFPTALPSTLPPIPGLTLPASPAPTSSVK